jgi:hypothetical protein
MVKIDKKVPLPPSKRIRKENYPFREMNVGDSFFLPLDGIPVSELQTRLANAWRHCREEGKRFTSRRVEGGVRVWRID